MKARPTQYGATQHAARCSRQSFAILPRQISVQRNAHGRRGVRLLSTGTTAAGTTQSSVVVFTTQGCPYCQKAKQTLRTLNVVYQEVDVSNNGQLRSALKDVTGSRTVPQVYVNGTLVGGSDDLAAKVKDGSLKQLLSSYSSEASLPQQLQNAWQAAAAANTQASAGNMIAEQLPRELQLLLAALSEPQTGVPRKRRIAHSAPTFTGQDLIKWLVSHGSSNDRGEAAVVAQQLLGANAVTLVCDKQPAVADVVVYDDAVHSYALRGEAVGAVPWGQALNTHYWWGPRAARPAEVVAEDLRSRILQLYDKHLSNDGRAVSYEALRADPEFWEYVDVTAELQRADLSGMSREALMCFAINLYNALVIHTLVVHGPKQYNSTLGRLSFFQKAAKYNIGGRDYVLDDLENGILRGNRPAASTIGMLLGLPQLSSGPFKSTDPRRTHVVDPVDPRIHFALVCGAKSCPPIKLYSPDTLEEGLEAAAEAFIAADVEVDKAAKKVRLSKIFSWYYPDFGVDKGDRLRFLLPYLPQEPREALQQMLTADPAARGVTMQHKPYDWSINEAGISGEES